MKTTIQLLILVLAVFVFTSIAQTSRCVPQVPELVIQGQAFGQYGQPIQGATVYVYTSSGFLLDYTYTNTFGYYTTFMCADGGTYVVYAYKNRFNPPFSNQVQLMGTQDEYGVDLWFIP